MSEPLPRYHAILRGKQIPAYLAAKRVKLDFSASDSEETLGEHHLEGLERSRAESLDEGSGTASLLDLKIELARRVIGSCRLCESRCGVDRTLGRKGECGVGEARIASHFLHHGEERPLVPSYTVFFAGCNFECAYCQNFDISADPSCGRSIEPSVMARKIENLTDISRAGFHVSLIREWPEKAKNVNWVGGDPTPNLLYILQVLKECRGHLAQIWNSNMYMSEESMRLLDGVMDLYLADFKYGNDKCAKRLSDVDDYFRVVSRNHGLAAKQADLLVRHLMLPGHLECCTYPVLDWLARNVPEASINIMDQYRPVYRASEYPELRTGVPEKDFAGAMERARELGLRLL